MIVYKKEKEAFLIDVESGEIEDLIQESLRAKLKKSVGQAEYHSWKNSMQYMYHVMNDEEIPSSSTVAIEYNIPRTGNRIDFIVAGKNNLKQDHIIIIELKQWSSAELTGQDAMVKTPLQGRQVEVLHPCYQAWSYSSLLEGFNSVVYEEEIPLKPCAYLHNYRADGIINDDSFIEYIKKAPLFLKGEKDKLRDFIKQYIKHGDPSDVIYRIDNGKIRPSKNLSDSLASMLKGNREFVMIDDQKLVQETALRMAGASSEANKKVLIVRGGPGTGKSVVAINLLVKLTSIGLVSQYVTKNSAPRTVYEHRLVGHMKKSAVSNLFKNSGAYIDSNANDLDVLVVDEAHRLNAKSGIFSNKGENQIKEIIKAAKFSVFFLDEDQRIHFKDIGSEEEIQYWATFFDAKVELRELHSQFRCNGSDAYIAWLDNALQIRETANIEMDIKEYDFRVFDSASKLRDLIFEKNKERNSARLVAGYCWDWVSKKVPSAFDIEFPQDKFRMRWNLASYGNNWIVEPDSIHEIGCIHTCQGLELDYVGVIIGEDMIIRDGKVIVDANKRSKHDSSIKGYKKLYKERPTEALYKAEKIVKNTYRTLMSRGARGCYLFSEDQETRDYFRNFLSESGVRLYDEQDDFQHPIAADPIPDDE